jgi:hypothetical protein
MKGKRSASEISRRKRTAAKLAAWRRLRGPGYVSPEDWATLSPPPDGPRKAGRPRTWPPTYEVAGKEPRTVEVRRRIDERMAARASLFRYVRKIRNATKQARTTARAAKLAIGDSTRNVVVTALHLNPRASNEDLAARVSKDPSTVRRARKPRK